MGEPTHARGAVTQFGRSAVIAIMSVLPACSFPLEQFHPPESHPPECLGSKLLDGLCLSRVPTEDVVLRTSTIDTATLGSGGCTEILSQPTGPSLCVIAGSSIHIDGGTVLQATAHLVDPAGTNPLVLFATGSIVIDGTLDVASHRGDLGGGARSAMGCSSAGNGEQGKMFSSSTAGGGGGAGGSFSSKGGIGGKGGNQAPYSTGGGTPSPSAVFRRVLGGCPGGTGGSGYGAANTGGAGGGGGGAVYLVADAITITGVINASGSGGAAGTPAISVLVVGSAGGGGGGGSGGMIGLEANMISVTGRLFASGGGGGSGFGGIMDAPAGKPGADPAGPNEAARGGVGEFGGGSGGNGSPDTTDGNPGQPGSAAVESAGGGGGGGAGVIYILGVSPPVLGGAMISPSPIRE